MTHLPAVLTLGEATIEIIWRGIFSAASSGISASGVTTSNRIALAGIAVSILGFGLAIWQLTRTVKASEATRVAAEATTRAVERTEERMIQNQLLILLPQFRLLEYDVDDAAERNDRRYAIRTLVGFSHIASELAAILQRLGGIDPSMLDDLRDCARSAAVTKASIIDDAELSVSVATKGFRSELATVLSTMGAILGGPPVNTGGNL